VIEFEDEEMPLNIQIGRRARQLSQEWDWEAGEDEGLDAIIAVRDRGSKVWSLITVRDYLR
jgi:hypothetical protein